MAERTAIIVLTDNIIYLFYFLFSVVNLIYLLVLIYLICLCSTGYLIFWTK
ncbi:hypothetical protein Hanom_Chr09g00773961 [Helianthus anomalus]